MVDNLASNQANGVERESNIELLKILAVMGVILLHCISPLDGAMAAAQYGSINYYILFAMESLAICAVNLFMLISGYFLSCSRKRRTLQKTIYDACSNELFLFREISDWCYCGQF